MVNVVDTVALVLMSLDGIVEAVVVVSVLVVLQKELLSWSLSLVMLDAGGLFVNIPETNDVLSLSLSFSAADDVVPMVVESEDPLSARLEGGLVGEKVGCVVSLSLAKKTEESRDGLSSSEVNVLEDVALTEGTSLLGAVEATMHVLARLYGGCQESLPLSLFDTVETTSVDLSLPFPFKVVLAGKITEGSSFGNAEVDSNGKGVMDVNGRDRTLGDLSLSSGSLSQFLDYIE